MHLKMMRNRLVRNSFEIIERIVKVEDKEVLHSLLLYGCLHIRSLFFRMRLGVVDESATTPKLLIHLLATMWSA